MLREAHLAGREPLHLESIDWDLFGSLRDIKDGESKRQYGKDLMHLTKVSQVLLDTFVYPNQTNKKKHLDMRSIFTSFIREKV